MPHFDSSEISPILSTVPSSKAIATDDPSKNETPSKMEKGDKEHNVDSKLHNMGGTDEGGDEDTEGMDMKAKALTKLLQTSSVRWITF